jgi:hypothetical protein
VSTSAHGSETERWQALFAAIPDLPATAAETIAKIRAQPVDGKVRIEIADEGLRSLQRNVDDLFEPSSRQSAAQMRQRLKEIDDDPGMKELARKLDQATAPAMREGKPPTREEFRKMKEEVEALLGPCSTTHEGCPSPPLGDIATYRMELQRTQPRAAQFQQRLFEQQRRFAQLHADIDRVALARQPGADAAALARDTVERHQALARQQLADAQTVYSQARDAVRPRFQRLAELARAAEQRNAPPAERVQAYALFKSYIELLLTLQRETMQDVGFWAGVRVRQGSTKARDANLAGLYELSLAPDVALQGNGVPPATGPHYPEARAIVLGLPPGIR